MNNSDFFDNIVSSMKISILDEEGSIKDYFSCPSCSFSNVEYLSNSTTLENINSNITVINSLDTNMEKEFLDNLMDKEEQSFLVVTPAPIKNISRQSNVSNISNIKTLEDKIVKIYKDRYKDGKLFLNFTEDIKYNIKQKKLYKGEKEVSLTQREFELLELFLNNVNTLVEHKTIQSKVWHASYEVSDSAYKSLLNKLRSKIGKKTIKSISGKGYTIRL